MTARTRPSRAGRSPRPGSRPRRTRAAERGVSSVRRSGRGHHGGVADPVRAVAASTASLQVDGMERGDPRRSAAAASAGSSTIAARLAPPRPELVGEVAHQDRGPAVGCHGRAEVRRRDARVADPRRASRPATPRGCRRRGSPGRSSRARRTLCLRTNRRPSALEQPERGPGPAVGRERRVRRRRRGRARRAGRRAGARASRSRACGGGQHGAGTSWLPGGPSSRYSTNESGQLRVSTTTSGSIVEAFSSTWISPAGM